MAGRALANAGVTARTEVGCFGPTSRTPTLGAGNSVAEVVVRRAVYSVEPDGQTSGACVWPGYFSGVTQRC